MEKYTLWRIQRQPTPPKSVSGCGGNLVFGRLAAIFAELEFTQDLSTSSILQPKGQAMPYANLVALHQSLAAEWDWLAAV
jgi:hypothetical protein